LALLAGCGGAKSYEEQAEDLCREAKRDRPDEPESAKELVAYLDEGLRGSEERTRSWNRLDPPVELTAEHERILVARQAEIDELRRLLRMLRASDDPAVDYARTYPRVIAAIRDTNRAYRAANLDECVEG